MKHATTLMTLTIIAGLWAGCDEAQEPTAVVTPTTATTMPARIEECVVCGGHRLKVKTSTPRTTYAGRTYYFCSPDCLEAFNERPAEYVASATTRPDKAADSRPQSH